MNISIQTLRAFSFAAETGSFTQAARLTYMTQPAFSRLIASFEKEMGVKLFTRTTRRVELTQEGQLCLLRARQILDSYELLLSDMERARHSLCGELHVGYNPLSGPPEFLIQALRRMGDEYPGVKVTLSRGYSYELVSRIKNGLLDCALVSECYFSDSDNLKSRPLQTIFLYALIHEKHPLASKQEIHTRDLAPFPLIFMKDNAPLTRLAIASRFQELGLSMLEDVPAYDLDDMIMRVRIGSGIGITSFSDPNHLYPDLRPIILHESMVRTPPSLRVLAWHKNCQNPSLEILLHTLEKEALQAGSAGPVPFD